MPTGPWATATSGIGVGDESLIGEQIVSSIQSNIAFTGTNSVNPTESAVFTFRQAPTGTLTGISVAPSNPTIPLATQQQFTATGTYSDGSSQNLTNLVTWASTNTTVATITSGGMATGAGSGSATIEATSGSMTGSTGLTVTSPALVSIAVTPANGSLALGLTQQFTATGIFSDGSTLNLTSSVNWTSANPAAATITSTGLATGVGTGSTTIQATSGSLSGSTGLTVTPNSLLVGWWKFDDGSGIIAVDSSGGGNGATLVNGVSWVAGKIGDAVSANGVNQYVAIPAINLSATKAVTWTAWVNRTYSTVGGHVLFENSTNFNSSTTGFGFFPDDGVDCPTSAPMLTGVHGDVGYTLNCYAQPSSGVWHHVAVVYDKSQPAASVISLYLDGVLQTPKVNLDTATNTNSFDNNPLYLFSRGGTQSFAAGEVDDLRLYNAALSAAQIQQIYQAGSPSLVSIVVTPANASIASSTTQQFMATGIYSDGSTQNLTGSLTWTSSNPAAATITSTGLATGVATGVSTIQATSGAISGGTSLTVTSVLLSITVTPGSASIAQGLTQQYTATGIFNDGTLNVTSSATWVSTNPAVAIITSGGLATAVGAGSTTIQATWGGIIGSTGVTVTAPVLMSIAVTPTNSSITTGATQQFTATGTYSDNSTQNLTSSATWTSTITAVATINTTGLATSGVVGTTSIEATAASLTGSTTLTVTSANLVGWWKFDDGSGTTAADSSGNGLTAILVNGMGWVKGQIGDAIYADGANQYGTVPAINLSGTSTVTAAMWVNRNYSTSGGHTLLEFSANSNSSTTGFGLFPDDSTCGGIQAALQGNVGYSTACYAQPSSGVWHHIAVVYDKTQTGSNAVNLYIDGVLQTATSRPNTVTNTNGFGSNPLYFFSRGGTVQFAAGEMDDLRLYNVALSASQIQQLYQAGTATLVSIAVTPANPSVAKGTTQQFMATGTYSDGSIQNLTSLVTWTSSSTTVATITSAGLATGAGTGSTTIQATSGSISGSTGLTVAPPGLVSMAVTPVNGSVVNGSTQQFTATGTYTDSSTQNLTGSATWASSNTAAATISSAGLATGVAAGSTTIQASSGSIIGSTGLTVTATALVSIAVTPITTSILKGAMQQFSAMGTYTDNSTLNLTNSVMWSSSTAAVATITNGGLAAGVGTGGTTIQAALGSNSGSAGLTVTAPLLVSITVTPANSSIPGGTNQQFTATGIYSDGSTLNLTSVATWTSTSTAVATISSGGLAAGVAAGSTTIQATSGAISGSTALTAMSIGQFVQRTSGNAGAARSSTILQSQSATAGNLILVFSHWDTQTVTASVTDNAGNTYTAIGTPLNVGTTDRLEAWYAKNIKGGIALAITVTYSALTGTTSQVDAIEYSGLNKSAPLDVHATATGYGASLDSGPSPSTTAEDEFIVGLFGSTSSAAPYAAGSGFTLRGYSATSMEEDQPVGAIGSYHATSTASAEAAWGAFVIGFKSAVQAAMALSLSPTSMIGGIPSTGTVTLGKAAPTGGAVVMLTSSNTAVATVPASVTVAAGATTATFTVNTTGVAFTTGATISATYTNLTESVSLTLLPAAMSQVASDSFNRSNAPTLGSNWSPLVGSTNVTLQITGNKIESTAISPSVAKEMYYGGLNWAPDQYSQVQIVAATGTGTGYEGPAVRMTSNDTHYACVVYKVGAGNASVGILLDNAGTTTKIASSTTATVAAGDTVRCTVQGTSLVMTDQTTSALLLTVTNSTIPSGYPGVVDSAGTVAITNYAMANWTAGSSAAPLAIQQLASDNFNRPDALNLGTSWNVGPGHGPIQIVSQQIQPYPAGGTQPSKEHYVAYGPIPNDQWSQLQVVVDDTVGDVAAEVRASDTADTMYICDINLTGVSGTAQARIALILNGVIVPLVIDQQWTAISPSDYIRGQVQGNLISLIDVTTGTLLLTTFDTNIPSGYPGISLNAATGNPSDHIGANWSGGVFGAGN